MSLLNLAVHVCNFTALDLFVSLLVTLMSAKYIISFDFRFNNLGREAGYGSTAMTKLLLVVLPLFHP